MSWISADKPPQNHSEVLIAYLPSGGSGRRWKITTARYAGEWRFLISSRKSWLPERVKFWMPFPAAPE